ncbi:MAG: hydrogenase maturation nickel metallochaperone HypA [Acidimicrobiales bacterium]
MHELSICRSILSTAADHAEGRPVSQVTVQVGHLRQVVPHALQFGWAAVSAATALEDAVLVVEEVPAAVECASCRTRTILDAPVLACGRCRGIDVRLISGEELRVVSITLAES